MTGKQEDRRILLARKPHWIEANSNITLLMVLLCEVRRFQVNLFILANIQIISIYDLRKDSFYFSTLTSLKSMVTVKFDNVLRFILLPSIFNFTTKQMPFFPIFKDSFRSQSPPQTVYKSSSIYCKFYRNSLENLQKLISFQRTTSQNRI